MIIVRHGLDLGEAMRLRRDTGPAGLPATSGWIPALGDRARLGGRSFGELVRVEELIDVSAEGGPMLS